MSILPTATILVEAADHIYEAMVHLNPEGEFARWNGFVGCPWFTRPVAERIAADCNRQALDVESPRFVWAGDTLLQYEWDGAVFGEGEPTFVRTEYRPQAGRYPIGSFSWAWHEVTESEARALVGDR